MPQTLAELGQLYPRPVLAVDRAPRAAEDNSNELEDFVERH
jgi:hypothetical protein